VRWGLILLITSLISGSGLIAQTTPDSLLKTVEDLTYKVLHKDLDTNFIQSHEDEIALRILATNRANYISLRDKDLDASVRYRPNLRLSLGVGVSYKWLSVALSFDAGIIEGERVEEGRSVNLLASVFTAKHYLSALYNYELGYKQVKDLDTDIAIPNAAELRSDIRTLQFGLDYLYVFNYGKFSLKAPFALTQIQKKSAGSVVAGASFFINTLDADSSMVPVIDDIGFTNILNFTDLTTTHTTVSVGYFHTFVYKKHWYLTLSGIPSLSLVFGDYKVENRELIDFSFQFALNTLSSLGYNGRKFFSAIQLVGALQPISISSDARVDLAYTSLRALVGMRFGKNKNN